MTYPSLKIRILGSGTSTGVPTIGCFCSVCSSDDPKNNRTRASIMITNNNNNQNIVIDTTPDFRTQMLKAKVSQLENVLYTHTHADHCHGFDDLRAFYFSTKMPVNCYLKNHFHSEFLTRFSYAFNATGYLGTAPKVVLKDIPIEPFEVIGLDIETVELPHGNTTTTGFKFGSFVYATDFKTFPKNAIDRWKGKVTTMVASGLRFREHQTHSTITETIELFNSLGVKKGYITHLSHEVDYLRDSHSLPKHVSFAYDNQSFLV